MYSYNDFERLFVRYKPEGIPAGVSIEKSKVVIYCYEDDSGGRDALKHIPGESPSIISRSSSAKLLKDVGIMNLCCP